MLRRDPGTFSRSCRIRTPSQQSAPAQKTFVHPISAPALSYFKSAVLRRRLIRKDVDWPLSWLTAKAETLREFIKLAYERRAMRDKHRLLARSGSAAGCSGCSRAGVKADE